MVEQLGDRELLARRAVGELVGTNAGREGDDGDEGAAKRKL
nr:MULTISPECIES: hypothetical protein [Streptomyces]